MQAIHVQDMMWRGTQVRCIVLFVIGLLRTVWAENAAPYAFHHVAPDQHKLSPGWQEPGLWRPRWVMDRSFDATEDEPAREDRVYFKLKSDRSMVVIKSENRPVLEILKPKVETEKKRRLFEEEEDDEEDEEDEEGQNEGVRAKGKKAGPSKTKNQKQGASKSKAVESAAQEVDGTWWWQDASPLKGAKVKLETREGKGDKEERIRHDATCEWGVLDGYAARFKVGKIIKYKMSERGGVPLGTYQAGTFLIRVTTQRPLVGKEFLAFE